MAYKYRNPETGGWIVEIPGTDDGTGKPQTYDTSTAEGRALEASWEKHGKEQRDKWAANIGNWQQYKDASIDDFARVLNKDPWYSPRLARYANSVMNGDTFQYNLQFNPESGNTARGHELTNRYIALLKNGYTNQQIMGAGYGNDGSTWAWWDKQNTNPGGGNAGGDNTSGGMLGGPINPQPRRERKGTWGSGYKDGGYSLLGEENQAMRQAIGEQLEKKLLG